MWSCGVILFALLVVSTLIHGTDTLTHYQSLSAHLRASVLNHGWFLSYVGVMAYMWGDSVLGDGVWGCVRCCVVGVG